MKSWRKFLLIVIITLILLSMLYDKQLTNDNGQNHSVLYPRRKQFSATNTTRIKTTSDNTKDLFKPKRIKDIEARLQNAAPHDDKITKEMYDRAFLWRGNTARLRMIFRDVILKKKPISMATIGGSVSAGGGIKMSCEFPCLYMEIVAQWLQKALGVRVESRNVAIGGTNSEYYAHCLDAHVAMETTHIIIGEFATNDRLSNAQPGFKEMGRPLEELIRNVKQHENEPAFILADFVDKRLLIGSKYKNCSFDVEQDYYKPLLEYYDITGVSLFNLVCSVYTEKTGFYGSDIISYDGFHPNHQSHRLVAIILIKFFTEIIKEVLTTLPSGLPKQFLPAPFFNRTWISKPVCFSKKRHLDLDVMSYANLSAIELHGFNKYVVSSSHRRFNKYDVMEYRRDLIDGYKGSKRGDWLTLELVAPSKPPGSAQQLLSLGYINCEFCTETVVSVWLGSHKKPISPVFNFTTFKYSAGTVILRMDGIDLSSYVKEGQKFKVTVMLNGAYDMILHVATIAWRYLK